MYSLVYTCLYGLVCVFVSGGREWCVCVSKKEVVFVCVCVCVCLEDVTKRAIPRLYLPVSWVCSLATLIPYAPERGRKGREEEEEEEEEERRRRRRGRRGNDIRGKGESAGKI